ncbi:hypothetical protein MRB53_027987 [Persea americana]|uniref:Uncharacterized protein n=1 Tax=Persea americana TaxID=3435 RepID=A0ACC2KEF6_PERAE|nr:hypothetical protein MRB53_027987 [Persea americana]
MGYVSDEQKKRYGLFGYGKRSREMGYVSDEQKKRYGLLDMGREAEKWVMFLISRRKDTAFGYGKRGRKTPATSASLSLALTAPAPTTPPSSSNPSQTFAAPSNLAVLTSLFGSGTGERDHRAR